MNLSGSNSTTFSPSASVPVLLLAGGFGTRLRSVDSTRPKPMVLVEGKPFLHWLVAYYVRQGFRHFLISTCYLAEIIEQYPWAEHFQDCRFEFYRESTPLGTGGAVRRIFQIKTD